MIWPLRRFAAIFIFFLLLSPGLYASGKGGFNFYAGAGPNFIFPTALRVGWNDWEMGSLGRNFLGFNKIFQTSGTAFYSSFGFGISQSEVEASPGLIVAVGFNYSLFWQLSFRGEMLANASTNGNTNCHGLLGVAYGF